MSSELSHEDRKMLDFEREWWKYAGAKRQAIKSEFEMSEEDYHRRLGQLIATQAAYEYDPMLIKRLRRLSAQRARQQKG